MPLYGTPQAGPFADSTKNLTALQPGDILKLFNAEVVAAPASSIAFNRGYQPGGQSPASVTFAIAWAAANVAASIDIQAAMQDVDSQYQTIYTSQNKQLDFWTDKENFAYYRVQVISYVSGGALTVTVSL